MRISRKLTLLTTSMFVAPFALAAAQAQDETANDLNAQALAEFRADADAPLYDESALDPRGEGDIEAGIETGAGDDVGDALDEAGEETGDWVDDAAEDAGDAMDDAADETGDALDDAGDAIEDAADDAEDAVDETAEDLDEPL